MIKIADVISQLEKWYPKTLAYEKDPVGLLLGSNAHPLTGVLVTLDVTEAVIDEAVSVGANLIVAHHPVIYKPLKTIDLHTVKGRIVEKCIKNDISVYAMHTNYDIAEEGMNDVLAKALGLTKTSPLIKTHTDEFIKLAVYVPCTHVDEVRQAMGEAGVGQIGYYSHCTFTTAGSGQFRPLAGSQPFIGNKGLLETVEEAKIEGVAPAAAVNEIMSKIRQVHPYEEIAYDVLPMNLGQAAKVYGLGRVGEVSEPMTAGDYVLFVKKAFGINHARFSGQLQKKIKKVAVIGGSGSSFIWAAQKAKADLYITGDIGFHDAQDAMEMGMNVLDVGHYAESLMKSHVGERLQEEFEEKSVHISQINTDPFQFI